MPRSFASLFVATALATIPACANHGDEGLLITKNVAVTTTCAFTSATSEPGFPSGQLSVFSNGGYQFHPQLESRILADTTVMGSDLTHTVIVQGADVDLVFADPTFAAGVDAGLLHFQAPFSVNVPPNEGVSDGSFELIPLELLQDVLKNAPAGTTAVPPTATFETTIIATVTVFGDMSGDHITSQPFVYPVTICNDCVVDITGGCPLPVGVTPSPGNACNIFEDGLVTCCIGAAGDLECPGPTM